MGKIDEFERLLADATPALFRRALLLSHDWQFAEDLVQETGEVMLRKWRQVKAAENPTGYALQILTNRFLAHTRKRSFNETPAEIVIPDAVDPWKDIDTEISVAKALAALAPLERAVIVGRYVEDLSVRQVSEQLGKNESWVRVTAHRSLKKLRELYPEPDSMRKAGA